jgi:hypothetical protein
MITLNDFKKTIYSKIDKHFDEKSKNVDETVTSYSRSISIFEKLEKQQQEEIDVVNKFFDLCTKYDIY